ncbi:MAG: hypothetical protein R2726_00215 [Acidimicrobiales bacterium]
MSTYVMRLWLPDRPGALGAVASRVGAVGGDVVGIDILERGAGRAIDELAVELPSDELVPLLLQEVSEVDGVDVEDITPVAEALHDPRLDALETAAVLVGAATAGEAIDALCHHAVRTVGAEWGAVLELDSGEVLAAQGDVPAAGWLSAFVAGSREAHQVNGGQSGPEDVVWAPLPGAGMALVLGRQGAPFRARERRHAAALARIVDTRFRELRMSEARLLHPAVAR